ncbi:MAG: hypothetical protein RLY61_801 [Candidatus Parcubacteria bacterium]|jgi:hypothetical protein
MKINLLNQKNEQTLNSIAGLSNEPNLSPNLYPKAEAVENAALVQSKKNFTLLSKLLIVSLLFGYVLSIVLLQQQTSSTAKLAQDIDRQVEELETYTPEAQRISRVNKRIKVHQEVNASYRNVSNKITALLSEIQTDENLLSFEFTEKKFLFDIARADVLDVSRVLELILAKDFVEEVAILEANLNTSENKYVIKMEITFK